jgi:prepilin-type N-terminal cleavage/methylation domain-containing protein
MEYRFMNNVRKRKGFTLIELLVVIAIIAILAAILFPVFAQAKESAKKITSVSNVKQLATATIMYQTDNDDVYPFAWGRCIQTNYTGAMNPYVKAPGRDLNNDGVQDWNQFTGIWQDSKNMARNPVSYGTNSSLSGVADQGDCSVNVSGNGGGLFDPPANASSIPQPAEIYWLALYNAAYFPWEGAFVEIGTDNVRAEQDFNATWSDPAVIEFFRQSLTNRDYDYTDGFVGLPWECPLGAWRCKYFRFAYNRNGVGTGQTTLNFADGHAKNFRWGQLRAKNMVPEWQDRTDLGF